MQAADMPTPPSKSGMLINTTFFFVNSSIYIYPARMSICKNYNIQIDIYSLG
jgi:hypothetical protein